MLFKLFQSKEKAERSEIFLLDIEAIATSVHKKGAYKTISYTINPMCHSWNMARKEIKAWEHREGESNCPVFTHGVIV